MLENKQKMYLRALGNSLEPVVFVGKGEVGANVIRQLDEALIAHELVKVRVLKNCLTPLDEVVAELAEKTRAEEIQVIGNNVLYYRANKERQKIILPQ